ncbi:DUF2341 domain-containing protein [Candidatus Woesearchaeota archaeon]|nr:DUF2341 domain-containing protein [Candidatus Woesearchaeota archaeon]
MRIGKAGARTAKTANSMAMIVIVLAITLLTTSAAANNNVTLTIPKTTYYLGERVTITITGALTDHSLKVQTPTKSYKFSGEMNGQIPFIPKEDGNYRVILTKGQTPLQDIAFKVSSAEQTSPQEQSQVPPTPENASESEENKTSQQEEQVQQEMQQEGQTEPRQTQKNRFIRTEKKTYSLGETVTADISADPLEYQLYYEYSGLIQKHMGDFRKITLRPKGIGLHLLILRDKNNSLVEEHEITVDEPEGKPDGNLSESDQPQAQENTTSTGTTNTTGMTNTTNTTGSTITKGAAPSKEYHDARSLIALSDGTGQPVQAEVQAAASQPGIDTQATENQSSQTSQDRPLRPGKYDVVMDLSQAIGSGKIRSISLSDLQYNGSALDLRVEEVPLASIKETEEDRIGSEIISAYAIDPTRLNFTRGTLTATANGRELWKCAEWNFTARTCEGNWAKVMSLKPGQDYELLLSPQDPAYAETGVASINTNQSVYQPGQVALITIVALDTQGHLVPAAQVNVTVTIPGSTDPIQVRQTEEPERGIYEFEYNQTLTEGTYNMQATVLGAEVNSTMTSNFLVSSAEEFEIIRTTPHTTDPFMTDFQTIIRVTSRNYTSFNYTETLPANFTIIDAGGAAVVASSESILLTWSMTNNTEITYTAVPPLVTPELYELRGTIGYYAANETYETYEEARAWLLAVDPQYDTTSSVEMKVLPLDEVTFAIMYIDSSSQDVSIQVLNTTGSVLVSETDLNLDVDLDGRVDGAVINSTHFAVGVYDSSGGGNVEYYIYDRYGNQDLGATQVDTGAGRTVDIGMASIGDRLAFAWTVDDGSNDVNGEIWTLGGASVTAEWNVDGNAAPDDIRRNDVDAAGISSTRWVVAWFDDNSDAVRISLYDQNGGSGNEVAGPVTPDAAVGGTAGVAVTALRNGYVAMAYYDSVDDDISMVIYDTSADSFATVYGPADINTTVGTDSRLAISEVESDGQSMIALVWWNQAIDAIQATVYNSTGGLVTPQFIVDSDPASSTYPLLSVAGAVNHSGVSLCSNTFIVAYNNDTGDASYKQYYVNGTDWNGVCHKNSPSTVPTDIRCDGSTNCNIVVTGSVVINSTGSTDPDGDNITYHIEAWLQNVSSAEHTTDLSFNSTIPSISYDSYSSSSISASTTLSWAHTIGGGSNRLLVVGVAAEDATSAQTDVTGVTYNSVAMMPLNEEVTGSSYYENVELWYMLESDLPAAGSHTIQVTIGGNAEDIIGGAVSLSGVAQQAPEANTTNEDNQAGNAYIYTSITTLTDNAWLVDVVGSGNAIGGFTTATTGQTERWDTVAASSRGAMSTKEVSTAGLTWMNWTAAGSNRITHAVAAFAPTAVDVNSSYTTYPDADGDYDQVEDVTVTIEVDSYDPSGSYAESSLYPDVQLELYNGSSWVSVGLFGLNNTYLGDSLDTTNRIFKLNTTQASVLASWATSSNQDARIRGVNLDYSGASSQDQINITTVWVNVTGRRWTEIGNHTETTAFTWNTQNITDQTCVDLRSRAIDYDGSATFSSYYTKGACMNLSAFPPPLLSNIQCFRTGTGWTACSNILFGSTMEQVRATCTSQMGGNITNVSFSLSNSQDAHTYFDVTATTNSSSVWTYDIPDLTIRDSGNFNLHVTCRENPTTEENVDWWIPFGTLSAQMNYPTTHINVTRNRLFNWSSNITCSGGECGWMNATLDPIEDWWSTNYGYRSMINVTNNDGSTALQAGHTVNFTLNHSGLVSQGKSLSSGNDVRVTYYNGTSHVEIDRINLSAWNTATTVIAFRLQESLPASSVGANYTVYYGNGGAGSPPQDPSGVYFIYDQFNDSSIGSDWSTADNDLVAGTSFAEGNDYLQIDAGGADTWTGNDEFGAVYQQITGDFDAYARINYQEAADPWAKAGIMARNDMTTPASSTGYVFMAETPGNDFSFQRDSNNNGYLDANTQGGATTYPGWVRLRKVGTSFTGYYATTNPESGGTWNTIASATITSTLTTQDIGLAVTSHAGTTLSNVTFEFIKVTLVIGTSPTAQLGEEETSGKGVIPMYSGMPFYTDTANPMVAANNSCLFNMTSGGVCTTEWDVNATGSAGSTWTFYAQYESLNYSTNMSVKNTTLINITIISNQAPSMVFVNISPSKPGPSTPLNCTFRVHDSSYNDPLLANISWYESGTLRYSTIWSVVNGQTTVHTLSPGNTTAGETWWCGVTPSDHELTGNQSNSTSVLVLASEPPVINSIQCQESGGSWSSCSNVLFNDNLTGVRAQCTDPDGYVLNATFRLDNVFDSTTLFSNFTSDNSSYPGYWYFNNTDTVIRDSGLFTLNVTCWDNSTTPGTGSTNWTIPWGTITGNLINPGSDVNVTQDKYFNFTARITCSGGECGYINATLDPSNWWNESFWYRQSINLTENSGNTLTDYQFAVTLNTATPISQGHMRSDCGDLRFVNGSGTMLSYWIESGCNSANTLVWVKHSLAASSSQLIYAYYGNSTVLNASNATATLFIYEDMTTAPTGTMTGSAWYDSGNGRVELTNTGGNLLGYLYYLQNPGPGFYGRYETWAGGGSGADSTWFGVHDTSVSSGREDIVNGGYHFTVDEWQDRVAFTKSTVDNGAPIAYWGSSTLDNSQWHNFTVYFYNSGASANALIYYDQVLRVNGTDNSPQSTAGNYFFVGGRTGGSTNYHYVRNIRVMKYVNPQPTATLGTEISQTKGIIPMHTGDPFYTITANPMYAANNSCLTDMRGGDSCDTTWVVNATGITGVPWEFFVTYSSMNYSDYGVSNVTKKINITITANMAPNVSYIFLNPEYPLPNEDLYCNFTIYDPNFFDTLRANVSWYRGTTLMHSQIVSASNGVETYGMLGYGNTSLYDVWHCGVKPYDEDTSGLQVNSSNVTIDLTKPPSIHEIQCQRNNATWTGCGNITFYDNITGIRVNCTTDYMPIKNMTVNITNIPDAYTFFTNTTTTNISHWWYVNKTLLINNSGTYTIGAVCMNNESGMDDYSVSWTVPWGHFVVTQIDPDSNRDVEQYRFFTYTVNISCVGGECGDVEAILDPREDSGEVSEDISGEMSGEVSRGISYLQPQSTQSRPINGKKLGNPEYPHGLVTINPEKPVYEPGERVKLAAVALDSKGDFAPDEKLTLSIARPDKKKDTFVLDRRHETKPGLYETVYLPAMQEGTYTVTVSSDGRVKDSTQTTFVVSDDSQDYPFYIIRDAPVTIDPWREHFRASIRIAARDPASKAENILLTERIPPDWEIIDPQGAYVWESEDWKELVWTIRLPGLTGEDALAGYTASIPLVSPNRYGLKASVASGGRTYDEARQWMVAIDPTAYYVAYADTTSTYSSGGGSATDGGSYANTDVADCSGGTCTQSNSWVTGRINFNNVEPYNCMVNSTLSFNVSSLKAIYMQNVTITWNGCWHGTESLAASSCTGTSNPDFYDGSGGGSFDMLIQNGTSWSKLDCVNTVGSECGAGSIIPLGSEGVSPSWGDADTYHTYRYTIKGINSTYLQNNNQTINIMWRMWGDGTCGDTDSEDDIQMAIDYANLSVEWAYLTKSGMISTIAGTEPFYTTSPNPQDKGDVSCLSDMISGKTCTVTWSVNASGGINTTHEFYVIANVTQYPLYVNNSESTHIYITIRDTSGVPPVTTLVSPAHNSAVANTTVVFNCSATDNNGLVNATLYGNFSGTWSSDGTNPFGGTSNSTTFSRTLSEGTYIWNCLAYDDDGNYDWGNSNYTVTVDVTKPNITLVNLAPGQEITSGSIQFNFTARDNLDPTLTCNLTVDGAFNNTNMPATNGALTSSLVTGLAQGTHWWNVTCWDDAGNTNVSENRNFTIVDLPPTVVLNTPNMYSQNYPVISLSYTPNDNNGIVNATIYIDSQINQSETAVDNGEPNEFDVYGLTEGWHNWTVNVTDVSNLSAQAPWIWFIIDFTPPQINVYAPANKTTTNNTDLFNFSVTDNLHTNAYCNITINGVVWDVNFQVQNGTNVSRTISNIPDGNNYWNITCWDNASNRNTSETRLLNISAPPYVTLDYPPPNYTQAGSTLMLYYTPSDNTNVTNCTLIINGANNQTNDTIINNQQHNFTLTGLTQAEYNWTVNCSDNLGLYYAPEQRKFIIDSQEPSIMLNAPAPNQTIISRWINFNFTATDNVDPILMCNLTIDGTVRWINANAPSGTPVNNTINITFDGLHFWNVTCWDDSGNTNTSQNRNFTTSNPPDITLNYPPNGSYVNYWQNVTFNYTPSDSDGLGTAWLIISGTKQGTDTSPDNYVENKITHNFTADGIYIWTVNVTDTIGLEGTASPARTIIVDTTPPNISIITPYEGYTASWNNVTFTFNATDLLDSEVVCNVSVDGTAYWDNISVENTTSFTYYYGLRDGNHNWSVWCIDNATNTATRLINFTVDAPPNVTLIFPSNGYRTYNQTINFTYTPADFFGFDNCLLYLNGAYSRTDYNIERNVINNFTLVSMSEGDYNWTVLCTDETPDSNTHMADWQNFSIDISGPTISLDVPNEGDFINDNDVYFNWTATDYIGTQVNCSLYIDDAFNSSQQLISGSSFSIVVYDLTEGPHNWSVNCSDNIGNWRVSDIRNFTINAPDLYINTSLLTFNNTNPDLNEQIMIIANVSNIGGVPAMNAFVEFWDGDPGAGGTYIGNATKNVTQGNFSLFTVSWTITAGHHTIYFLADPYLALVEQNDSNNNATINISVLSANITAPPSGSMFNVSYANISFNMTDYTGGSINYTIFVNGAVNATGSATDQDNMTVQLYFATDGTKTIILQAKDGLGRAKNSTPATIYVDTSAMPMQFITPTPPNNHLQSTTSVIINVSHSEPNPDAIKLYWNGALNISQNYSGSYTNFTLTSLGDGIYNYYVWANDTFGFSNQTETRILRVDLNPPMIIPLSPLEDSTVASNAVEFLFMINDSSRYANCSLYINDTFNKSLYNMPTNANVFFALEMEDGEYSWYVNCSDAFNRSNVSDTINFTVMQSYPVWSNIWYETHDSDWANETAYIDLAPEDDFTENFNNFELDAGDLFAVVNATSPLIGGLGGIITPGTLWYNGTYQTEAVLAGYLTWKVYLTNESGDYLIAQYGDDSTGGVVLVDDPFPQFSQSSQNVPTAWMVKPLDRLRLVVDIYNADRLNEYYHYWDDRSDSRIEFANFIVIGEVNVTIVEPANNISTVPGEIFNQTCEVDCLYGTCVNTYVYAQYNSTLPISTNWTNISGSGNLKLNNGTNPVFLGNISAGKTNVTFAINGTTASINNVRCYVKTDYDDDLSDETREIVVSDFDAPTVNLNWPTDRSAHPLQNITLNFTVTDNVALANCTLYFDGTYNQTKYSANLTNGAINNFTLTYLTEGNHTWNVTCQDTSGNIGNSTQWIFVIDRTRPVVTLLLPPDTESLVATAVYLNFTVTDNIDDSLTCNLTLDGTVIRTAFEVQNASNSSTLATSLSEGTHYWNVTCWDNASNIQNSSTWSFSTYEAPIITLIRPANNNISNNPNQTLFFNVNDYTGIENCSLILDGALNQTKYNSEITNNATNNFTLTGLNGTYSWAISCYDNTTVQAQNTTQTWNFIVDIDPPQPSILTSSGTWFNTATPQIQFNITDNYDLLINYTLYANGIENINGTVANASLGSQNLNTLTPDGEYTIILQGKDDASNVQNSSNITIYVDTTKPWINLSAPPPNENFNATSIQFNFTAHDNMAGFLICNFTLSNGMNDLNLNLSNATLQSINKSGFVSGIYYWNVSCYDIAGNWNTSATWNFTINTPDVTITSANITFNESEFEEGRNITIHANVQNIGGVPAYNFTVQIWHGDPDAGGTQINGNLTITSLAPNANYSVSVTYSPIIGPNNIYVAVDPPTASNGSISEENESNNKANNTFEVPLYHKYAGNITGLIEIEKQSVNLTLYTWSPGNTSGSHIFVADLEGIINFLSLQAIGRDTTNQSTADDFEEIDTAIGSTNLSDSINRTYTTAGAPKETGIMNIYGSDILNIPLINSSANTTFKTGILWDESDGGLEYNGTQDIVFVSETSIGKQGSKGIYDFEIAVPALLRDYNAGGSSVAFYVELR